MALLPFIPTSLIGRGMRFFLVAGLMRWGGEKMERKLMHYVDVLAGSVLVWPLRPISGLVVKDPLMCSRVWQGSGVVVLSWLLLACSSSKTAAPVHSLGNDQVASTIPVRQGMTKPGIAGNGYTVVKGRHSLPIAFRSWHGCGFAYQHQWHHSPITFYPGQQLRLDGASAPWRWQTVGSPCQSAA